MIRAFSATDKTYITNGDAVIQPTKAKVKNTDNGDYTLELTCGSQYNDFIQPNNIIVVPTPTGAQPFRIREVTKKSNRLEVKAWHVFYDAVNYLIADSYAVDMTCKQALEHFNGATDNTSPFIVDSNVLKVDSYRCVRTSLLDCINTVLERWGGHLVRDGWNISILSSIGVDNGVTIQYKKNLQELTASYDWGNVCTKLLPVGKDGILLDELYLYSDNQYEIPYTKSVTFSQEIEKDDYPDEATYIQALKDDLRRQGNEYLTTYSVPVINYTLKANPEKVTDIGDIIEVIDERIGVNVLTRVISYEYDCITERYTALEFGNFTPKLSGLLGDIKAETSTQITQATQTINVEVNAITEAVTALDEDVAELVLSKQDKLTAGDHISVAGNVVKCLLTGGSGIEIENEKIKLAPLDDYTYKNNIVVTIDTNALTAYIVAPAPIDAYTLTSVAFSVYDAGTITSISNATTGVTVSSEVISGNILKITLADGSGTLTGLQGAYMAYIEATITNP